MFCNTARRFVSNQAVARARASSRVRPNAAISTNTRLKSSSAQENDSYAFDENGEASSDIASFSTANRYQDEIDSKPVLLNAKEHADGYLSSILNARVYEAAIETELQEAKNLSSVSTFFALFLNYYAPVLCSILLQEYFFVIDRFISLLYLPKLHFLQHLKNNILLKSTAFHR